MIYGYAVDPGVISNDLEFFHVFDKFDYSSARRFFKYPKNWKQLLPSDMRDGLTKKRLKRFLEKNEVFFIDICDEYDGNDKWLKNVENNILDFDELKGVVNKNKESNKYIKLSDFNNSHERVDINNSMKVSRETGCLFKEIKNIIKFSKRIYLVDPYFDITKDECYNFIDPLIKMYEGVLGSRLMSLNFCVSDKTFTPENQISFKGKLNDIRSKINRDVELYIIEDAKIHNRFLLSNIASVSIGNGLSDNSNKKEDGTGGGCEDDDVSLLSYKHYKDRLSDYTLNYVQKHLIFKEHEIVEV